jgi:hypothetical protein
MQAAPLQPAAAKSPLERHHDVARRPPRPSSAPTSHERLARPSTVPLVLRSCACGGSSEESCQCDSAKGQVAKSAGSVPSSVVHKALATPGEPLAEANRADFEARLGTDLSGVRVHTGQHADESARAVGARAYTVGQDLVFRAGAYSPGSSEGWRLLAHELVHVAQAEPNASAGPASVPSQFVVSNPGDAVEREAELVAAAMSASLQPVPTLTAPGRSPSGGTASLAQLHRGTLARYAHKDCVDDDLKGHVWPADDLARKMVDKALTALSASPVGPSVAALFPKYFMTSTPDISAAKQVLTAVQTEFAANDYTYECEDDCKSTDNGYTWSGIIGALTSSHIHLCMNNFRSRSNECLARTIVHEFTHRYANTDDNGYCKSGCGYSSCPSDLTPAKALDNADSYACFAYELWGLAPAPAPPPPAPAPPAPPPPAPSPAPPP